MAEYKLDKSGPALAYETRQLKLALDDIRRDFVSVKKPLDFIEENLRSKLQDAPNATVQSQIAEILDIIADCDKALEKK